ncbi:MAG TPA: DPP IV N-terminal domain-containing protein, partial [Bacteroidota bacterium]|nr:DPP IV N-terminal domain-containing protein [Bacteroidota bacterium]
MRKQLLILIAIFPLCLAFSQQRVLTAEDYARAEKFLPQNVSRLVVGGSVTPKWLPDERFWYRNETLNGVEYVLIDPVKRTRSPYSPSPSDTASVPQQVGRGRGAPTVKSPDGKWEAFIRNWNLWVREVATGNEKQLTTDGEQNFGYATDNAGWRKSDRPIIL